MSKLSPISALKLIKFLEKLGFIQLRQKGSHIRMEHPNGRKTSIPMHAGEKVGVGLLRKILKDSGVSRRDFEKLK